MEASLNTAPVSQPNEAVTKPAALATTPRMAAIVDEGDQDTPEPSPQKKPKKATNTITDFFGAIGGAVGDAVGAVTGWSPLKRSQSGSPSNSPTNEEKPAASNSPAASNDSSSSNDSSRDDAMEASSVKTPEPESAPAAAEMASQNQENNEVATPKDSASDTSHDLSTHVKHYPQAESPNMPWKQLWTQMRREGWDYRPG